MEVEAVDLLLSIFFGHSSMLVGHSVGYAVTYRSLILTRTSVPYPHIRRSPLYNIFAKLHLLRQGVPNPVTRAPPVATISPSLYAVHSTPRSGCQVDALHSS